MRSNMSILGMLSVHPDLFSKLKIPIGIDKDTVIDSITIECAELELLYTEPETLRYAIGTWSTVECPIWEKLKETTEYEYNPIENYDRHEEYTDTDTNNGTVKSNVDQSSRGKNSETDKGSTINKTTAYNSDEAKETARTEDNGAHDNTTEGSTNSTENATTSNNRTLKHEAHLHGNIGVTSSQQMINEEREVVKFSIINYIVQSFKFRFCLLVY